MNRNRKWKYVGKAVLSGVLVTSLLVGNIGYAEAKPISQEETVYVELAEDGSVKEVTVSDLLKQEGKENVTKEEKADKDTKLPVDVTITYLLDGKEISVSRDRLMDTERINNRWSLEETDAMIAPLKGTWTTDTYMGYVLPYNLRKFEPDTYADEEARETFFGEYHEAVRAAEESPVPDISVEVQPVEEYEDGYTIRVNGYESPFSIILSTERINDEYPIYSDTTTLSESFFVEYPVVYIKLFAKFKDGESDRYNPATVIVSADGQVLLLMEGAFYSLERR